VKFGQSKGYTSSGHSTEGGDYSERWIKGFKDGSTVIRLLEPQESWTKYWEHYDRTLNGGKGAYFPCTGDRASCPGCTSDEERTARASARYLVNALVGKYVDIYKLPLSVADKVVTRAVKDEGDVLARAYEVMRTGKAPNIEYDVEREEYDPIDPGPYVEKFQDHEQALQRLWDHAFGTPAAESAPEPEPRDVSPPKRERPLTAQQVAAGHVRGPDQGADQAVRSGAPGVGEP
jgi:hypothetical protein